MAEVTLLIEAVDVKESVELMSTEALEDDAVAVAVLEVACADKVVEELIKAEDVARAVVLTGDEEVELATAEVDEAVVVLDVLFRDTSVVST